jgi:hypothetical protein
MFHAMADDRLISSGVHIMPAWAGGWDNVFGAPYAPIQQATATMRGVARLMQSVGGQHFGEIGRALANGVGASTDLSIKQVQAIQADGLNQGGLRPIVSYAVVSIHNTTIVEKEAFQSQMTPYFMPMPTTALPNVATSGYPVDKSGNGGGGKAGTIN